MPDKQKNGRLKYTVLQKKRDLHICRKLKYEKCGEKSILDERHVVLLGFQSKARINRDEMYERWDCPRIILDEKFLNELYFRRGLFSLPDRGLYCDRCGEKLHHMSYMFFFNCEKNCTLSNIS